MKIEIKTYAPEAIEKASMAIISELLGGRTWPPEQEAIIKRVIHTSADFDYADNLIFSPGAVAAGQAALQKGCTVYTDTRMAWAGINQANLTKLKSQKLCYIDDPQIKQKSSLQGVTRAALAMEKIAQEPGAKILAIGNAPTALIKIYQLVTEQNFRPDLIIGVPVGFVNVIESKELIQQLEIPFIVAAGRKGGSNVAAAIVNALMLEVLR